MFFEKLTSIWQYVGILIMIVAIIGLVKIHKCKEEDEEYLVLKMIGFYLLGAATIAIGLFISSLTESQVIASVVSFITLLLTFLLSNITGMLPTEAISQCVMIAVLWLVICLVFYHMMNNVTVLVMMAVIGEAAIWIIYAVKSSLYESLLTNILNTLALSTRFDDFSLGILNYDAIVYYVSIAFLFVFLTIQMIKKKRFN